jgi:hypothetical protein
MSAVLTPLGPAPEAADRDLVSSWFAASMQAYLDADERCHLHAAASRAVSLERSGADCLAVMLALAGAEGRAARLGPEELSFHAARLDAYAAAHDLRGWYRYTGLHGEHRVQVNALRSGPSNVGRYYVHHLSLLSGDPRPFWVIDRDTGRTVATATSSDEAQAWIVEAGGVLTARVETVAVAGAVL